MKRYMQITISCLAILVSIWGCRQQKTYQPTLESVMSHSCPEWFKDAKFGMFIDWGIYSVPGWAPKREKGPMYPDWYLNSMYEKEQTIAYHKKTWGADFSRDDLIIDIPLSIENNKPCLYAYVLKLETSWPPDHAVFF